MKFETTSPQKFLFSGAISDLNFLGPYNVGADLNLPRPGYNVLEEELFLYTGKFIEIIQ